MKKELHIFLTAIMFYTRIPCPKWVDHNPIIVSQTSKYISLIGILVGGIGSIAFYGSSFLFSNEISLLFSILATIYATAGFHEDGFADVCDGFGGGWTKDKILSIMKDSSIGVYGAIGIILILAFKFSALREIDSALIPLVIISAHSASRFIAASLLYTHPYVRITNDSKSKAAAQKIPLYFLFTNFVIASIPLLFFNKWEIFLVFIPMYLSKIFLGAKFKKWIGGQTGDCAGAVQQISEVVFYLSFIALWKYI
ncbi:adenosylcobinamide-GDP ribazoletransferase [Pseudofulvibacter geojedonensis]|uniref:Adenosylcobinamide-GDP ribazoletransferase n=1 Tax=Pseudofulvibacter geojedonensis TaxID=1123758 RepID=A0ABW3HZA3_9FLAO